MEVAKFIQENIMIFFFALLVLVFLQIFIRPVYTRLSILLLNSRVKKYLLRTGIAKSITTIILPLVMIALLIAIQQKYGFIQIGNKNNYNALVISILTLYGILYTFLQFTIGYALQNKNDKYWGRSITKELFFKHLGFNVFNSTIFRLLLLYVVIYPNLSQAIHTAFKNLNIAHSFPQAFWEASILIIYILYTYLFLKSLNIMRVFYDIQEKRSSWLERNIKKSVAEEYQQIFEYSFKENSDYFLNVLFHEVKSLDKVEQIEMIMHVLNEVFSLMEFIPSRRNVMYKIFSRGEHEFNYRPFYLHNFFNRLYDKIEKSNIELDLRDLLVLYRLHDNVIFKSMASLHVDEEKLSDEFINVYSITSNWTNDEECTYFMLPSVLVNRISSCDDIEEIHQHVTKRIGFRAIQKTNKSSATELKKYEKMLVKSYDTYLYALLEYYKNYVDELKHKEYSYFWGSHRSYDRTGIIDERTSDIIYNYIIRMECTEKNKKYVVFLTEKLEFKYKVSMVFYHMLYTGPSWEWKREILFFRNIIDKIWVEESITDEHVLDFVCYKIKNSNIGHRIRGDLIRWVSHQVGIRRLNQEIIERCLSERYMSFAQLLKFIFIFSNNRHCPMDFYNFDFKSIKNSYGWDWKINFLIEMTETPKLLGTKFISEHLNYFFKKISFTSEHFVIVNDFRVFFLNPFFKLSESQFNDLLDNHFPGKGIIEFLILHFNENDYKYLTEGTTAKSFLARVTEIINIENKPIKDYVEGLVSQANECRNLAVSVVQEAEIINGLQHIFKQ